VSEYTEQCALIEWVARCEGRVPELALLLAIPNGEKRDKITGARLKRAGVRAGVPDLFLPVARHGAHGLWLELKDGKGRTGPAQRVWMQALLAQGYDAHVAHGWEAAARLLCAYLGADAAALGVTGEHAADAVGVALAAAGKVRVTR